MDGGKHFLDHGDHLAFFFADVACGPLDAPRVGVHHKKQERGDGERDQGEAPVHPGHYRHHSGKSENIDQRTQQARGDKTLDIVHVAGDAADQVSGPLVVMERQRKPLYVGIKRAPQIKGDPLPDAGGEVFFRVRRDGIERRNEHHRQAGKLHDRKLVSGAQMLHEVQDGCMWPA